jgi:cation transport ATPase
MNLLVSFSLILISIHRTQSQLQSQISLGVSVAYFSSIAELAISASRDPNDTAVSAQSTTYFDSVVFLTMFLLIGTYKFMQFSSIPSANF